MRSRSSRRSLHSSGPIFLLLLFLLLQGCAGARYPITAGGLKYATSFSPVLPGENGKPLYIDEDLAPLGDFDFTRTPVGLLYSGTRTTVDLSDDLNREVERLNGQGIVGLSIKVRECVTSWLFPLTVLPFYPGCHTVSVSGTVVARKGAGAAGQGGTP
jgi:hypothetical protein